MTTDEEIGRNVALCRGDRSQADVAGAMRKRGFRWSQATVWAVEKGERPLRLAEAEVLGEVLEASPNQFLMSKRHLEAFRSLQGTTDLVDEIYRLAGQLFHQQVVVAIDADEGMWDDLETLDAVLNDTAVVAALSGMAAGRAEWRANLETTEYAAGESREPTGLQYTAFLARVQDQLEIGRQWQSADG